VPPASKTYEVKDTVGPLLRSSGVSKNWRAWTVDVVKKMTDRTIVTIKNDFSQAKCTKHYINDYSEKKDACKGTAWADRVHLHKYPGQWTVKPAKGTDGKCFNIINHEKLAGCLRYLSASSDCKARHLKLVEKDDGSGLQQWRFVEVSGGGGTPSPPPPPPASFYLASNGVTVKCPGVAVGGTFTLNGVTYTKRDRDGLRDVIKDAQLIDSKNKDVNQKLERSCTTGVTDMSKLFYKTTFGNAISKLNPAINSWDTSSVTTMYWMWVLTSPAVRSPAPTRSRPRSLRASLARSPGSRIRISTSPSIAGTRVR
jgi:surface protein